MALHLDRLIILRKIKFQEADLIVHGINSRGMRISFLAKSALKSKKRFGGGVFDPFHYVEIGLARPPKSDDQLLVVQEARLLQDFEGIKKSYNSLQVGFQILEMVYKVIQVGDPHGEALFQLLGNALTALEACGAGGMVASGVVTGSVAPVNVASTGAVPTNAASAGFASAGVVSTSAAFTSTETTGVVSTSAASTSAETTGVVSVGAESSPKEFAEKKSFVESHNKNMEMIRVSFTLKFLMQQGVLKTEPWMQPFLSTPIREPIHNLNFIEFKDQVKALDSVLQQYLLTAQV
jgi:hypothetical protein